MSGLPKGADRLSERRARERRRLHAVRLQMVDTHPFWGYLLLQMRLVQAVDLPTFAATDCLRHIWYNPDLTRHLHPDQVGFVLAHEIGHQLLASGFRRQGRNLYYWNCATDYAINRLVDRIQRPGTPPRPMYRTPNGTFPGLGKVQVLLDRRFDGKVAELIYEVLLQESAPSSQRCVEVSLESTDGAGHKRNLSLPNVTEFSGGVDVHLPEFPATAERTAELAGRIETASDLWHNSQQRGDCPAELVREILAANRPTIPWQRVLHQFADVAFTRDEWSLARPSLRFLDQGIVVPGPVGDGAGHLVVSVDSSASMSAPLLAQVASELKAIARLASEVTVVVSDSVIQQVVHSRDLPAFLASVRFKGGGGTDHRPVFQWLNQQRITPNLFVGLTDLYSCYPHCRPHFPVLWVVPKVHGTAPWGHLVTLPDHQPSQTV